MKTKVVLADDHPIITEGLKVFLETDFDVVATVNDGRSAIKAVRDFKPRVVILDIAMPLLNGIETARRIRKLKPQTIIVFLSMYRDLSYVQEAFGVGALGYVIKSSASAELPAAIHQVLAGRRYITPGVVENELEMLVDSSPQANDPLSNLTPRQREVLQLVVEGRSAKQAAAILNISPRTVEFHKYRLMEQLGLPTVAHLTQFAIRHKIISG